MSQETIQPTFFRESCYLTPSDNTLYNFVNKYVR